MKTKLIKIGTKTIGNNSPILVQSMCNTKTSDIKASVLQIHRLETAGCEIVRLSVPDIQSAKALKEIKKETRVPVVADIHFDYKLALESAKYVDKLRINPGNIGDKRKIKKVIDAAKEYSIPIRIGVNLGSIEKEIENEYGRTSEAMIKSAEKHIKILEENNFSDIVVSLKASDVKLMIAANRLFANQFDYPLHLGVTEAGSIYSGTIRNSVGLGALLSDGIGDTIRVSLAGDPVEEIRAGFEILKCLNLRKKGITVIACPTCARASMNVALIAEKIENETRSFNKELKIAVMGCAVNGPGEVKDADIGVFGGKDRAFLYINGKKAKTIEHDRIIHEIISLVEKI